MSVPTPNPPTPVILPTRNYVRIKIVSLGDACTGKSCLIKRYCEKKFVPKYISTIGVDFGVRQVRTEEGVETKVNFCQSTEGRPDTRIVVRRLASASPGAS